MPAAEAPTEKLRMFGAVADPVSQRLGYPPSRPLHSADAGRAVPAVVDQLWLRCAVVIGIAVGTATVAITVATYLWRSRATLRHGSATAWPGLITLGLPAAPWFYLRQLRELSTAS